MSSGSHPVPREPRRSLRLSVVDGMAHAAMLGFGESYLGALAVELGHIGTRFALLATVPLLVGAVAQLGAERLARALGGRKTLVVWSAAAQALLTLGFVGIALWQVHELVPFLLLKCAFWAAGAVLGPAWNDWIGELTEGVDRARYLGRRSAMVQGALVVSFVGGGELLAHGDGAAHAFATLFVLAALARLLSVAVLAMKIDTVAPSATSTRDESTARLPWRTALYVAALWFGAMVSVPFFTPYMLTSLDLDYATFARLLSLSIVAKVVTLPLCYRWVRRWGLSSLLVVSGAAVATVPLLWVLATDVRDLVFVELIGGTAWAGWEYSTFQLLLSGSSGRVRMRFLGVAGALAGLCQVGGSLLGGQLLDVLHFSYREVFMTSTVLRALSLLLLFLTLPELVRRGPWPRLFVRLVSVRSASGPAVRPIVPPGGDVAPDR